LSKKLALDETTDQVRLLQLNRFDDRLPAAVVDAEKRNCTVKAVGVAAEAGPMVNAVPVVPQLPAVSPLNSDEIASKPKVAAPEKSRTEVEIHHIGTPTEDLSPPLPNTAPKPVAAECPAAAEPTTSSPSSAEAPAPSEVLEDSVAAASAPHESSDATVEEPSGHILETEVENAEEAAKPDACDCNDHAPSDWNSGCVRVLFTARGGVPSCQEALRSARIEQWCRKCSIEDVIFKACDADDAEAVADEDLHARLRQHIGEHLAEKSQPGDTWVLHFTSSSLEGSTDAARDPIERGAVNVDMLPSHVTIVCLTDSLRCLELLGLDAAALASARHRTIRVVSMMALPSDCSEDRLTPSALGDLCANAMLRTADALSLAGSPATERGRD
jgi:hypothetical protein